MVARGQSAAYRLDEGEIAVLVRHGQAELRCEQCGGVLAEGLGGMALYCPDCHIAYGKDWVADAVARAMTALTVTWQALE